MASHLILSQFCGAMCAICPHFFLLKPYKIRNQYKSYLHVSIFAQQDLSWVQILFMRVSKNGVS